MRLSFCGVLKCMKAISCGPLGLTYIAIEACPQSLLRAQHSQRCCYARCKDKHRGAKYDSYRLRMSLAWRHSQRGDLSAKPYAPVTQVRLQKLYRVARQD